LTDRVLVYERRAHLRGTAPHDAAQAQSNHEIQHESFFDRIESRRVSNGQQQRRNHACRHRRSVVMPQPWNAHDSIVHGNATRHQKHIDRVHAREIGFAARGARNSQLSRRERDCGNFGALIAF
jgi:hypothetical protein